MSLDLYSEEAQDHLSGLRPVDRPETGVFDGFLKGTGMFAMRNFARAGSAVDLAGAVGPIAKEYFGVGEPDEVSRYFKEHDDIFGSAIKYWTPKPDEVGVAAEVAGGLLSTLPLVIASPAFAVGATYMGTAEELMQKGISPGKAQAVGAAQAVGLGLGVWMPILGQNLWQRVFVGGAGFNTAQGIVLRGASGALLEGTQAGDEFKAFDGQALTLDVLLGLAFGSVAHLSPAQRAQGGAAWERIGEWARRLDPSQVDAIATLRQAQHSNVDSAPGKLAGIQDVAAHVDRLKTAIDQLAKGDQVAVDDHRMPEFAPDPKREAAAERRLATAQDVAERVRKDEGIPEITEPKTEAPAAEPGGTEPPPPRGAAGEAAGAEAPHPALLEAEKIVAERPDLKLRMGTGADGEPVTVSAKDYLEQTKTEAAKARENAKLIATAAQCLLGI